MYGVAMKPHLSPHLPVEVERKYEKLKAGLKGLVSDGLVVAFSGGVDSAFLLWAAEGVKRQSGGRVVALTALSESMAAIEREDAERFARDLGVEHRWERTGELKNPDYAANDHNRCYYCKSELFRVAGQVAAREGCKWLAYGYNASDVGDVRPGHRAAKEYGVVSPLYDAGLGKDDIRMVMRAFELQLAEKSAAPCLSSRLMAGVVVTAEKLRDVEYFEQILRAAKLNVFRVRYHEEAGTKFLRIEVEPEQMGQALKARDVLVREAVGRGYRWVLLDLAGYQMGGATAAR